MANITWLGRAAAVSQVDTITIADTWTAGDTIEVTIGGATLTLTVGAIVTTAGVAAALKAMLAGDALIGSESRTATGPTIPQFAEVTFTVSGSVVTCTGPAGKPFTMSVSEATAGDGTATEATATAASGPNDASVTSNWSTGALPGAGDTIFIRNSSVSILYGLTAITGTLTAVVIDASYTGSIGLPETNIAGYPEYRTKDWTIDVSSLVVGIGEGLGMRQCRINTGSVATAVQVYKTASSGIGGIPALLLSGSNAANTLEVQSGAVGVAIYGGEAAQYVTVIATGGSVRFGAGATLSGATFTVTGNANISAETNVSTVVQSSGVVSLYGAATLGTLTFTGGTYRWYSSGTISACTLGGSEREAVLDATVDLSAKTVTALTLRKRGRLKEVGNVTVTTLTKHAEVRELRAA